MRWRDALEATLTALFPPRCGACDKALAVRPRFGLCPVCLEVLEPNNGPRCPLCDEPQMHDICPACASTPPPFVALRAPWIYGGPLADLVVAAKFRGREDLAVSLAELIIEDADARALAAAVSCVVPVPLSWARQRERGYNQSAIIARRLARLRGLRVVHALRRTHNTAPQSDLPLSARHDNVRGAFRARKRVTGRVLLIDDVVTSTETTRAAASRLLEAGASEVVVLAAARAALPS